jgi:hypothetical protein
MQRSHRRRGAWFTPYTIAILATSLVVAGATPAQAERARPRADVASAWLTQTISAGNTIVPPVANRAWAMAWLSALRALETRTVHTVPPVQRARFADAAVASAVHDVLVVLAPSRKDALGTALAASLAAIPDGPGERAGIKAGKEAASRMLHARDGDGFDLASINRQYTPPPEAPGVYRLPPDATVTITAGLGDARPFLLGRADRFRPGPPPAIGTDTYRRDLREVQVLGSATSNERTREQTATARLWAANPLTNYTAALIPLIADPTHPLTWKVALLAAFSAATVDSMIAVSEAKFIYVHWRPITAIREADTDGDPRTQSDKDWNPLLPTPPTPEYPSGHAGFAGAAQQVLEHFTGRSTPMSFTISTTADTGEVITRAYPRGTPWSMLTQENIDGRVSIGAHFRTSDEVGADLGRRLASYDLRQLAMTT